MSAESPAEECRPLRADARRNRERVIAAATEAFASEAMAVSMDEIARRAGVGVGTIYRQFPTKESLYAAVCRHGLEQIVQQARALCDAEDPGEALFTFVHEVLDAVAAKRDLVETLEHGGTDIKAELADVHGAWEQAVGVLVERAQRAGALRADVTVGDVLALVSGTCAAVMNGRLDPFSRDRLATVVCDGLARHQAQVGGSN